MCTKQNIKISQIRKNEPVLNLSTTWFYGFMLNMWQTVYHHGRNRSKVQLTILLCATCWNKAVDRHAQARGYFRLILSDSCFGCGWITKIDEPWFQSFSCACEIVVLCWSISCWGNLSTYRWGVPNAAFTGRRNYCMSFQNSFLL